MRPRFSRRKPTKGNRAGFRPPCRTRENRGAGGSFPWKIPESACGPRNAARILCFTPEKRTLLSGLGFLLLGDRPLRGLNEEKASAGTALAFSHPKSRPRAAPLLRGIRVGRAFRRPSRTPAGPSGRRGVPPPAGEGRRAPLCLGPAFGTPGKRPVSPGIVGVWLLLPKNTGS